MLENKKIFNSNMTKAIKYADDNSLDIFKEMIKIVRHFLKQK